MGSRGALLPFALLAAFCAGCGAAPSRVACPAIAFLVPVPPQMLYPEPNATAVPDGNFPLVLSYGSSLNITLTSSTAPNVPALQATAVPSPLPSPAATPGAYLINNPVAYAVPALSSHSTYSVVSNSTGECAPPAITLGTFTTR